MRIYLLVAFLSSITMPVAAVDLPSWMSGTWRARIDDVQMEEHWSSADARLMVGVHRDTGPKKSAFEFLRIERQGDTLVYLAMPGGKPATAFRLKSATVDRIVFENPEHDFPQRVIYWRADDRLCARVEGTINGAESGEQWCWTRVAAN